MSLRLARITLREIRMPLREPFEISSGRTTGRRILLLELADTDGATAWSECVAGEQPSYSAETVDTAWHAVTEWIAPRVLAAGISHPRTLDGTLRRAIRGHPMARAAVEMGAWTLQAGRDGVSLSRLLGGTRAEIATGISIGIQTSPAVLAEKAAAALAQGYRRIKMKIRPGADIEFIAAAREALGPDAPLMADANSAYTLAPRVTTLADLGRLPPADARAAAGAGRPAPARAAPRTAWRRRSASTNPSRTRTPRRTCSRCGPDGS